jgi:hypothetical protein
MPPDVPDEAVDVLLELPGEARLADAGDPRHRHELRPLLVRRAVEELLQQPQLAAPADKGRLQTGRPQLASATGGNVGRTPERHPLDLALQLEQARVLVRDRGLGGALGRLADEHAARLGG